MMTERTCIIWRHFKIGVCSVFGLFSQVTNVARVILSCKSLFHATHKIIASSLLDEFTAVQNGILQDLLNKQQNFLKQSLLPQWITVSILDHIISLLQVSVLLYPDPKCTTENTTWIHNRQSSWHTPLINKIYTYKQLTPSALTNY